MLRFTSCAGAVCAFAMAASVNARPIWVEAGDAGQTIATHQDTIGNGSLDQIVGSFLNGTESDVYCITITNPGIFSATTNSPTPGADHQIQLFTMNGVGIAMNDDIVGGTAFTSQLPAGNALYANLSPGMYLLGISEFDNDPYHTVPPGPQSTYVFPFSPSRAVLGPDPSYLGQPFINYDTTFGPTVTSGPYTIDLTGAGFCRAVPEPISLGVIATGSLLALRRRRV